jgi:hypothetical protein
MYVAWYSSYSATLFNWYFFFCFQQHLILFQFYWTLGHFIFHICSINHEFFVRLSFIFPCFIFSSKLGTFLQKFQQHLGFNLIISNTIFMSNLEGISTAFLPHSHSSLVWLWHPTRTECFGSFFFYWRSTRTECFEPIESPHRHPTRTECFESDGSECLCSFAQPAPYAHRVLRVRK